MEKINAPSDFGLVRVEIRGKFLRILTPSEEIFEAEIFEGARFCIHESRDKKLCNSTEIAILRENLETIRKTLCAAFLEKKEIKIEIIYRKGD